MRSRIIFLILFVMTSGPAFTLVNEPIDVVKDFYKKYIDYIHTEKKNSIKPRIQFSKQFQKALERNRDVCDNYATGICGWQADGDEYLDAQETDPNLTFANSGIAFRAIGKGLVEVRLNVYPSEKTNKNFYLREIKYKMIIENGIWVVDDIIYKGSGSSRKTIEKENAYYLANPDPDSKIMKKKK
jgi:hypothetical protein